MSHRTFTKEEIEATDGQVLYAGYSAKLPTLIIAMQDELLLKGALPEAILAKRRDSFPDDVYEITVKALYWRKEQLLKREQAQFN